MKIDPVSYCSLKHLSDFAMAMVIMYYFLSVGDTLIPKCFFLVFLMVSIIIKIIDMGTSTNYALGLVLVCLYYYH